LNWESGGCETGALIKKKWISTGNHFEEEDFHPDNCDIGRFHLVLFMYGRISFSYRD
jgi:hypothetical protein